MSEERSGVAPRRLAVDALMRIDGGAYANLVVPALLDRTAMSARDRGLVTELVYGTTRRRRACDWLVDRFLTAEPDPRARTLLRLGAYQLVFLDTPAHAAVSATVGAAPRRLRGLVNAVLRRVAEAPRRWPDRATELSYPDWIIERLTDDLGTDTAYGALEAMNEAGRVTTRSDGYVQDPASTAVAAAVEVLPGAVVVDLCAAPGGKTTALAAAGARVVALDRRASRMGLVVDNVARLGHGDRVWPVVADGTRAPVRSGGPDAVLVDAPCSGLGVLRRRPDARWRVQPEDVSRLAAQQRQLLAEAAALVRPGGLVVYSVCTLTAPETVAIDSWSAAELDGFRALDPPAPTPGAPWRPAGRGARLLPQDAGTDGMYLLRLVRRDGTDRSEPPATVGASASPPVSGAAGPVSSDR